MGETADALQELRARVASIVWFHTIDLGNGIVTPGYSRSTIDDLLPAFEGKAVLDIGAWDGYYSFLAEKRGARHVLALDHYAWGVDFAKRNPYWEQCFNSEVLPDLDRDLTDFWDPQLGGMRGFLLARDILGSNVESRVDDFATMDIEQIGPFDISLFLGVLYHLRDPLGALTRLRKVTSEVAVIETAAIDYPGLDIGPILLFTAGTYNQYDYSNWYFPTESAAKDLCRAAGFSRVETIVGPPSRPEQATRGDSLADRLREAWTGLRGADQVVPNAAVPARYRLLLHAYP